MGYSTNFIGNFKITLPQDIKQIGINEIQKNFSKDLITISNNKDLFTISDNIIDVLNVEQSLLLVNGLAKTRRMGRNMDSFFGVEGEFYFDTSDFDNFGQSKDNTVIDSNKPPKTQPELWLQWIVNYNEQTNEYTLEWDQGEKFYGYIEWLEYLIKNIFEPKNILLNGSVNWEGEDRDDVGTITIVNNTITIDS